MKEVHQPQLNYDGVQVTMLAWWDPPPADLDHPFAGVGEGVDYGETDKDHEWWKEA